MRILILNSWYFPNLKGGAEHSVKLLAENLANKGHSVGVFTIDSNKRRLEKDIINKVLVYRGTGGLYDIRKAYRPRKTIFESIKNRFLEIRNGSIVKELSYVYNDFRPNIVHINCIAGISLSAILYFHIKQIPIVYTLRDYFLDSPRNIIENTSWKNPLKKLALTGYRWYTKKKSLYADAVTAPSLFTLNYYLNNGFFKHSIYKECVVNSVEVDVDKVRYYISEKKTHTKRNFMFAGSVTEVKGIKPMLEAFMQTNIDTNLFICGDGNLLKYIQDCSKKDQRIKPLGKLESDQLEVIYRQSDIMIVPSLWAEPFGRVVIEAAKYGLYVIASVNGGIPEIIRNIGCGEICNVENINELKDSMEGAYSMDFEKYYSNIKCNISKYSINDQIDRFEKIYSNLLER